MYLPRGLISHLYTHLLRTHNPSAAPILILSAVEPDALCACRILTALLKRDYIPHKIQPIAGYGDLRRAAHDLLTPLRTDHGGDGGMVICLGVGASIDLEDLWTTAGGTPDGGFSGFGGVEFWILDARRPWNLKNVFGAHGSGLTGATEEERQELRKKGLENGEIRQNYVPGQGGVIVFDDGDIEQEMHEEKQAYFKCVQGEEYRRIGYHSAELVPLMQEEVIVPDSAQPAATRKRKSSSDREDDSDSDDESEMRRQRRRGNSSSPIPSSPGGSRSSSPVLDGVTSSPPALGVRQAARPSKQERDFERMMTQAEKRIEAYSNLGSSYSEPVSSLIYSLASELGREDNDLLWHAIVGVSSLELYGRTSTGLGLNPISLSGSRSGWLGQRGEQIRSVLRDEVRRLNPADAKDVEEEARRGKRQGSIPTTARSPTDMAIRLSPEPRFLLVRHWSLYDSMLHSPYISTKMRLWSDHGRRKLLKLLAMMGVSLTQCKQSYTHMDMELKRTLREKLIENAKRFQLDDLMPAESAYGNRREGWGFVRCWGWKACLSAADIAVVLGAILEVGDAKDCPTPRDERGLIKSTHNAGDVEKERSEANERTTARFWTAYDALNSIDILVSHISTAQHLHRAILRTGTSLIEKRQVRNLQSFHFAVIKEGPDVQLFTHAGALIKLALWLAEAVVEMAESKAGKARSGELVLACWDESTDSYLIVGLGGGGFGLVEWKKKDDEQEKLRVAEKAEKKRLREAQREEKVAEREREKQRRRDMRAANGEDTEDEEDEEDEEESEDDDSADDDSDDEGPKILGDAKAFARNRFGHAFQAAILKLNATISLDSFEHCVVEVPKDLFASFLEYLSQECVIGGQRRTLGTTRPLHRRRHRKLILIHTLSAAMGGKKNPAKEAAAAAKAEQSTKAQAQAEEQEWAKGAKSNKKAEAAAEKAAEAARKKAEKDALLKEEEAAAPAKGKAEKNAKTAVKKTRAGGLDAALGSFDRPSGNGTPAAALNATGIDNALDALSLTSNAQEQIDRHPERRFPAAYKAYEERRLDEMKDEKGLRRNQKIAEIKKEFERHPDNPFNQVSAAYNASKTELKELKEAEKAKTEKRLASP